MRIISGIENYIHNEKPLFLALGNFDGLHYGHKTLISKVVQRARIGQGTAAAFIFNPHPATILTPEQVPRMLVSAERKAELLQQLGLDLLIYHSFSSEIACWSPEEFVQQILVNWLKVSEVYVGFNYSFGHQGVGTPKLLMALDEKYGFRTHILPPVILKDEVVSSTLIRACLEHGDINKAYRMLGYYPG
jgi:riboflavin kinase/FMN adenylyltransferase